MKVKGKTIIVTGAGSGMGRELTIQLVQKGAKVVMADIDAESMKETALLTDESSVSQYQLNITDKQGIEQFSKEVIEKYGAIDGLINNAGIIQPFVDVKELGSELIDRVMQINFYGTLNMTKTFLPYLLSRPEAHIANVSSMGGFIPFPGQTVYGASKAAVKLLTEGLYTELKETNVGVTVIIPGAVNTNIMTNSGVESSMSKENTHPDNSNNTLSASVAASIMIDAIEKNKFRVLVGKDARMLDFLYRINPRWAVNFITKQMSKLKE